jgi:aminoglycoside phosphotransferase (APT) family kinase protein
MFDSKRLEDYLRLSVHYGNYSLLPANARAIRVQNIKKLTGGMANNVYSFCLKFSEGGSEQVHNLVLKGYNNRVSLWFGIVHPDEDARQYVREYDTLQALDRVGFMVPQAYLYETDSFFLGYPFLIMNHEIAVQEKVNELKHISFANTLATLHNLDLNKLGIQSLRVPKENSEFARERLICLKRFMKENRHYNFLKKNFDSAIDWLESNVGDIGCPNYRLIHGEYHPGHTLLTNEGRLTVIDWENAKIGDPAFDVGYAYNLIKVMYNKENIDSGEDFAEKFLSEYSKSSKENVNERLEFYKVVSLLGVAIVVSSWIADPIDAYRNFGKEALARSLAFPFFHSSFLAKRWLNSDFLVSYLMYSQNFIKRTLKR